MSTVEWVMEITLAPFIGVMILAVIARIGSLRQRLSLNMITYLYTALMVTSYFVGPGGHPFYNFGRVMADRVNHPDLADIAYPSFMAPSTEIVNQMFAGGISIPWAVWFPVILFWWLQVSLFSFFLVCAANIFRRQWLDIEQVPFPVTVATFQIADNIMEGGSGEKKTSYRLFALGFIMALLIQAPIGFALMFPWFPDIYGWRLNTCPSGLGYISSDSPLGAIVAFNGIRKTPAPYFIGYLVPSSILFNTWFWYLVYLILGQVFYTMGYYTGITGKSGCGRAWCLPSPLFSPPTETAVVANVGGAIMLTIMMLFLGRRYLLDTIRAALGMLPTDRVQEMEKNEAMSYRLNYLAIVVSFVLIVGMLLSIGMSPLTSVLTPISAFVFWFSTLRVYGSTGIQTGTGVRAATIPRLVFGEWGQGGPVPFTRDFALSSYFMRSPGGDMPSMGWAGGMLSCFGGYRMARDTSTSNKGVFRVAVLSIVIASVTAIVTLLFLTYSYGITKLPMGRMMTSTAMDQYVLQPSTNAPGEGNWTPYALFGMFMVGLLSIMHARFVWFPFEPIGFILGWGDASVTMGYWTPFAVAWVAKILTLRVGGSKTYEKYGVPFAVGGVAGCMLIIFITGALYVLKFYFPF